MALALAWTGACNSRALIEVDVTGDAPFQGVTLRLTAGAASKNFTGASFGTDDSSAFKAGVYVDDSGQVMVTARALDGSGTCIGIGQSSAANVQAGSISGPIKLEVAHSSSCTGGGSGAGGITGGGQGGNTGGGAGGITGGGQGGNTGGGVGGMTGGGQGGMTGNNLIMNGDFSNGETSWNLPAMMGPVTHAVTNGAFCVTLSQGNSSATVGYPAGGTAPLTINGGASYRFSYQASVSASNTMLEAKVGQTQAPYDATGSDWPNEPAGTALQTFTHTFTRGSSDSSMGVAFNLTGGPSTVCIDNVSLTPN